MITQLTSNVQHCKPQIYLYFLHLHKKTYMNTAWSGKTLDLNPDHKQQQNSNDNAYMPSKSSQGRS